MYILNCMFNYTEIFGCVNETEEVNLIFVLCVISLGIRINTRLMLLLYKHGWIACK